MIEETILRHLVHDESFARKVVPFVAKEYFSSQSDQILYEDIRNFITNYNKIPTVPALRLIAEDREGIPEATHKSILETLDKMEAKDDISHDWLLERTEKFCQDRAIYNAITQSIDIIQGKHKSLTKESLPELLKEALAISFDSNIGHDFFENSDDRWNFYTRKEEKVPFDLEYMNKITNGGVSKKTLNVILGGTNVGKSLVMCHMAGANIAAGKNVLYITMEMSEEEIGKRIDANLLNYPINELSKMEKESYDNRLSRLKRKAFGKLVIKQFPTASAHVGHFRHLLNELNLKKGFVPDVVYIDYLNISCSQRMKVGGSINSYTYVKAIAEEFRGLAVEKNIPIITATQTNRTGYVNSDPGLEDTSESFGLPATADFMVAIVTSEELAELGQYAVKQLKNRYADVNQNKRFVIGVDRDRMKLFDVEQSAQDLQQEDKPIMDRASFGERDNEERSMKWATKKMGRRDFSGLKTS